MTKQRTIFLSDVIDLKYMKNKDNKTCNPRIFVCSTLNLKTNELSEPTFTLKTYDNVNTHGYYNRTFKKYKDAKVKLNKLMSLYHIK